MASEEIASDEKLEIKDVTVTTDPAMPESITSLPIPKQQEQVTSLVTTTTTSKPGMVRPAPAPYGSTGTKGRSETTKFGRKGKRKFDSGQGTSATKKTKG